ncbi:PREDICTED: apoptotic chromatin condensation inducer in the nucleus-like [Tarenaya hassleriana]|uniref:apoptotic chromatin condensation inducer in the nucleus-like n=1 Tax=Tarenaya hassleriana TaxID=28532 RepID=UPI00053C910B|nr:PREDICTED: apoptotic chromatin condensation inducer in the nucleus-like [Tarenaya hassleriana]XP_010555346.1 PREDICTED: apoptotic chromatin condensation inducer in the nucleus-like [Tarenaya hassleriana]XP_010555348.1 PREDICTED: apoptotic chromatin condensation inducer in the nucleus-like [Tarenaya hassleriana]
MSSPYPILDNRPIDKWKVTELKEELKRRKLTTGGLKVDLIKRLDEALRIEKENAEIVPCAADEINRCVEMTPKLGEVVVPVSGEATPVAAPKTKLVFVETAALQTTPVQAKVEDNLVKNGDDDQNEKVDDVRNVGFRDSSPIHAKQQETLEGYVKDETAEVVAEDLSSDILMDSKSKEIITGLDDDDGDSKLQTENECVKAKLTDDLHVTSASINQVSEVTPVTGVAVKSVCFSTDSVSNNEKIELKDNVIADDVKLEHSVSKSQEIVEPSSFGTVEEPLEPKTDDSNDENAADMTKGNENIDAGYSEKLNLDRDSGDDSMDEEEADTKGTESNNSDEVVNKIEKNEVPAVKVETPFDVMRNGPVTGNGDLPESENQPVVTSEKRKLPVNDQEAVGNSDPVKRQRRWNSENMKVPEVRISNGVLTTPKSTGLNRNFSIPDSSTSEDGAKERVVPPPQKEPTNSLRIDRFLRPFTLKAVQELLGKTGNVASFWMDHIKTHCYVSYSSIEEATATRNAVYNLQWPPNGGRLLVAEFVDPEEVRAKAEPPQPQATPAAGGPSQPEPQGSKAQPPTALPPPPPLFNPTPARERLQPPPPPPVPDQQEPPILTLDDLFRKTKATPRIYYLPLSEDQVTAKLGSRGKVANE